MSFYSAYLTIAQSPSNQLKEDYQNVVDSEWEVSSSVYDIEEELTFGTQVYTTTQVRINHAINSTTGTKLGDDYRAFIFQDFEHAKGLGYRYKFNNNIWLCMNSDLYKFVTASTTVRRCNNVIKWYDNYDVLRNEPCVIDNIYNGTQVDFDQAINIPSGNLVVSVQYNQYTSGITINDRFLFGGQAFKVKSINNFFQNQTGQNNTTPLLYLTLYKDNIASGDDIINNTPAHNISYTISTNTSTIDQSIGYTTQLIATLKRNGDVYTTPLTWTSSDVNIATVDNNGNVNLIANGNCMISVKMTDNPSVIANVNVTVQSVPTNIREVRITPNVTELLQGQTQIYQCQLYVDGVLTPSNFTFSGSGVPSSNYVLTTLNSNSFSIKNLKLVNGTLLNITATNGTDNGNINIRLRGAF